MSKSTTKTEAQVSDAAPTKAKRKHLTPAERIEKMEAELRAVREKAAARAQGEITKLEKKEAELTAKRDEIDTKLEAVVAQITAAKELAGQDVES